MDILLPLTEPASPGEDSPLLDTEDAAVSEQSYNDSLNGTGGSISGNDAAANSPESDSPYTVALAADSPDYTAILQQLSADLQSVDTHLTEQLQLLAEQKTAMEQGTFMTSMLLGLIFGALLILGLWQGRK